MIEWRWGLPMLTVRDADATNLAEGAGFPQPKVNDDELSGAGGTISDAVRAVRLR